MTIHLDDLTLDQTICYNMETSSMYITPWVPIQTVAVGTKNMHSICRHILVLANICFLFANTLPGNTDTDFLKQLLIKCSTVSVLYIYIYVGLHSRNSQFMWFQKL